MLFLFRIGSFIKFSVSLFEEDELVKLLLCEQLFVSILRICLLEFFIEILEVI